MTNISPRLKVEADENLMQIENGKSEVDRFNEKKKKVNVRQNSKCQG